MATATNRARARATVARGMAAAMKRARARVARARGMAMATRVAGEEEGDGEGGKSNGNNDKEGNGNGNNTGNCYQKVGHLLFIRNTKGAKKKRFRWYQQEILLPGINDHCKWFVKFDASTISSTLDQMTAVTYCDGEFSQIDVIKSSINLFIMNKVITNEQHASWLAIKQPADLAKAFMLIKLMLPSYSFQNIPADRCPMKALMIDAFNKQLNDDLNLPPNKMKSIINSISALSEMATKACSVKNIQHGFIMDGLIDGINMCFPVFDTIISKCWQNPKKEEYENIEENMTNILYQSSGYGHIADKIYGQMGIVSDRDSMGSEVLHDATISQKNYLHAKCLTHEHQIHLW